MLVMRNVTVYSRLSKPAVLLRAVSSGEIFLASLWQDTLFGLFRKKIAAFGGLCVCLLARLLHSGAHGYKHIPVHCRSIHKSKEMDAR